MNEISKALSEMLTQAQLVLRLGGEQKWVSNTESGNFERVQIDTLRKYGEAVGGVLRVEVEIDLANRSALSER